MRVEELMTDRVATCGAEATLDEAARILWESDCGALPVLDGERRVVGVITDRDLCMGAWTRHSPLHELQVRDSMARDVVTCRPSDELDQVVQLMGEKGVRRLPVVDGRRRLLGMLSLADLARASERVKGVREARARREQAAKALAAVSRPRAGGPEPTLEPQAPKPARKTAARKPATRKAAKKAAKKRSSR